MPDELMRLDLSAGQQEILDRRLKILYSKRRCTKATQLYAHGLDPGAVATGYREHLVLPGRYRSRF